MQKQESTGPLSVTIGEENMEATVAYAGPADPAYSEAVVYKTLAEKGVVYGLERAPIDELVLQVRSGTERVRFSTPVAHGVPAQPSRDSWMEFLIDEETEMKVGEDGRTDFRNVQKFKTVEKGQPLGHLHPHVVGKEGRDVFGKPVPFSPPKADSFAPGDNIQQVPGPDGVIEYRSAIEGIFKRTESTFFVSPELVIEGNAGLETGNIKCSLTIVVKGNVERGTEITAGKHLHVGGFVETGFLRVVGNLQVAGGINSGGKGTILCGGNLNAEFIESSHVICDGNVHVNHFCLASTIVSHGTIEVAQGESVIAGGEIIHYGNVTVGRIGNANQIRTVFHPGIHYHNQQIFHTLKEELQRLEKEFHVLADYLREMKERLSRAPASQMSEDTRNEARDRVQKYHRLQESIEKKKVALNSVMRGRKNPNPVRIFVKDAVLPGTEFHFNGSVEKLQGPMHSVIITFSPEGTAPEYSPLV